MEHTGDAEAFHGPYHCFCLIVASLCMLFSRLYDLGFTTEHEMHALHYPPFSPLILSALSNSQKRHQFCHEIVSSLFSLPYILLQKSTCTAAALSGTQPASMTSLASSDLPPAPVVDVVVAHVGHGAPQVDEDGRAARELLPGVAHAAKEVTRTRIALEALQLGTLSRA